MSTLQERIRDTAVSLDGRKWKYEANEVREAANRIDELELALNRYSEDAILLKHESIIAHQFLEIEDLKSERDSLAQQVRTEQMYNQERGDRIAELEAYKHAHDEQVTATEQ